MSNPTLDQLLNQVLDRIFEQVNNVLHDIAVTMLDYHMPIVMYSAWLSAWSLRFCWRMVLRPEGEGRLQYLSDKLGQFVSSHIIQLGSKSLAQLLLSSSLVVASRPNPLTNLAEILAILLLLPWPSSDLSSIQWPFRRNKSGDHIFDTYRAKEAPGIVSLTKTARLDGGDE